MITDDNIIFAGYEIFLAFNSNRAANQWHVYTHPYTCYKSKTARAFWLGLIKNDGKGYHNNSMVTTNQTSPHTAQIRPKIFFMDQMYKGWLISDVMMSDFLCSGIHVDC